MAVLKEFRDEEDDDDWIVLSRKDIRNIAECVARTSNDDFKEGLYADMAKEELKELAQRLGEKSSKCLKQELVRKADDTISFQYQERSSPEGLLIDIPIKYDDASEEYDMCSKEDTLVGEGKPSRNTKNRFLHILWNNFSRDTPKMSVLICFTILSGLFISYSFSIWPFINYLVGPVSTRIELVEKNTTLVSPTSITLSNVQQQPTTTQNEKSQKDASHIFPKNKNIKAFKIQPLKALATPDASKMNIFDFSYQRGGLENSSALEASDIKEKSGSKLSVAFNDAIYSVQKEMEDLRNILLDMSLSVSDGFVYLVGELLDSANLAMSKVMSFNFSELHVLFLDKFHVFLRHARGLVRQVQRGLDSSHSFCIRAWKNTVRAFKDVRAIIEEELESEFANPVIITTTYDEWYELYELIDAFDQGLSSVLDTYDYSLLKERISHGFNSILSNLRDVST